MNRQTLAARAAVNYPIRPNRSASPSTDLLLRVPSYPPAARPVRNRRSPRMTATQRDSRGMRSAWNDSPFAPKGGWR